MLLRVHKFDLEATREVTGSCWGTPRHSQGHCKDISSLLECLLSVVISIIITLLVSIIVVMLFYVQLSWSLGKICCGTGVV